MSLVVEVRRGDLGHGASTGPAAAIHWQLDSLSTVLRSGMNRGNLEALQHTGIKLGQKTEQSKQEKNGHIAPGKLQ